MRNCGRDDEAHCVQLNGNSRIAHSTVERNLGKGNAGIFLAADASAAKTVVFHAPLGRWSQSVAYPV